MVRHRFAATVAVVVAIISGAVACIDSVSSSLNMFGFLKATLARETDFDGTNLHRLIMTTRIVFVLVATAIAYWIAFFIDAWRRPVKSVELSKKSFLYQYGPEACHVINELEKEAEHAAPAHHPPAESAPAVAERPAPEYGYSNFVCYGEIEKRFQLESKRAGRFAQPLSCLIMTVEPLPGQAKPVVDDLNTYIQRECPRIVWHAIRDIDSFAHYGDNGFIILLPGTDKEGAATVERRLRTDMVSCDIGGRSVTDIATIRNGLSFIEAGARAGGEELIRHAESSLLAQRTDPSHPCEASPEPQTG